MEKLFRVDILTPEEIIFTGEISSLRVPGGLEYFGVLANHAPLISTLVPGNIILKDNSGIINTIHSKGAGFLEVIKNKVTILLESTERI